MGLCAVTAESILQPACSSEGQACGGSSGRRQREPFCPCPALLLQAPPPLWTPFPGTAVGRGHCPNSHCGPVLPGGGAVQHEGRAGLHEVPTFHAGPVPCAHPPPENYVFSHSKVSLSWLLWGRGQGGWVGGAPGSLVGCISGWGRQLPQEDVVWSWLGQEASWRVGLGHAWPES